MVEFLECAYQVKIHATGSRLNHKKTSLPLLRIIVDTLQQILNTSLGILLDQVDHALNLVSFINMGLEMHQLTSGKMGCPWLSNT